MASPIERNRLPQSVQSQHTHTITTFQSHLKCTCLDLHISSIVHFPWWAPNMSLDFLLLMSSALDVSILRYINVSISDVMSLSHFRRYTQ